MVLEGCLFLDEIASGASGCFLFAPSGLTSTTSTQQQTLRDSNFDIAKKRTESI